MKNLKAINDKKAMTLTELLVASMLIGIVMLGVISFSLTIKNIQNSSDRLTVLRMRAMATMGRMSAEAEEAIGHASMPGIVATDTSSPDGPYTLCFRTDYDPETAQGNPLPPYANDVWNCFQAKQNVLYLCENSADCIDDNGSPYGTYCPLTTCGNWKEIIDLRNNNFFEIIEKNGKLDYVKFNLDAIYNWDLGESDPVNNPTYSIETSVSPIEHSR